MNANDIMNALNIVESIEDDIKEGFMTMEEIAEWHHMTKDELLKIHSRYQTITILKQYK